MSTFVFGKAHPLVGPAWYLHLEGRREQDVVRNILLDNCTKFIRDPHFSPGHGIAAQASMGLAMAVDCGLDRMGWYVNKNGGMVPKLAQVLRRVEAASWPDAERISVSRWPNQKHYYARVDGLDVVWEGDSKWNTETAARRAAEKFMEKADKRKI
jgi:hypothetical protein